MNDDKPKKQRRTKGSVVEIDLGNGFYNYAQVLENDIVFFDIYTNERIKDISALNSLPPLIFLGVYNSAISSGRWKVIGKLPIKEEYQITPMQFIQDVINPKLFRIYNPNTGEMTPSSREEATGLECAAVWEAEHVESRLIDHYEGRENIWVNQLAIK